MAAVDDPSYFEPSRDVAGYLRPISSRQSQRGTTQGLLRRAVASNIFGVYQSMVLELDALELDA